MSLSHEPSMLINYELNLLTPVQICSNPIYQNDIKIVL